MENNFAKSRFMATMEIMIHKEKLAISLFTGKKGPIMSHENTLYHPHHLIGIIPKVERRKSIKVSKVCPGQVPQAQNHLKAKNTRQ